MIEVKNLHFGYKSKRNLFSELNISLPSGSIIGLLGRNGEGKSTLMKLINGQLRPHIGSVSVLGHESKARSVELLQSIYMLGEEVKLPELTVAEFLWLYGAFYPTYSEQIAYELLELFELNEQMRLSQMSLGQKKKAQIALALSLQTRLLLLDEPTNGLDIPSKSIFRRALAKYSRPDQTIIISTHQVRDLEQVIDHLLLLNGNKIICNEPIATLDGCFAFGPLGGISTSQIVYREPSVVGEVGAWLRNEEEWSEHAGFSMELFFNAMIAESALMQRHIDKYKQTLPEGRSTQGINWLDM